VRAGAILEVLPYRPRRAISSLTEPP
jgi:hypothetical protein